MSLGIAVFIPLCAGLPALFVWLADRQSLVVPVAAPQVTRTYWKVIAI